MPAGGLVSEQNGILRLARGMLPSSSKEVASCK